MLFNSIFFSDFPADYPDLPPDLSGMDPVPQPSFGGNDGGGFGAGGGGDLGSGPDGLGTVTDSMNALDVSIGKK